MHEGFFLLDKPENTTSFQFLASVKHVCGTKRVGHTGTLDKFASGLLIALVGRYTRLTDVFMEGKKKYRATIRFGMETSTLDPEGEIAKIAPIPSENDFRLVLPAFLGEISQTPPVFSAVHIDGERSYERALRGEAIEPEARIVNIEAIEIIDFKDDCACIAVTCSKGTYIRSLARDMARACASAGTLVGLRRLASGPFNVENAKREVSCADMLSFDPSVARNLGLTTIELDDDMATRFKNGRMIRAEELGLATRERMTLAVFRNGNLLGLAETEENRFTYKLVMADTP